jgi:hypothetical protein
MVLKKYFSMQVKLLHLKIELLRFLAQQEKEILKKE